MAETQGRVAIITGAARGVGRATAVVLARAGCDIVAVDVAKPIEGNPQSTASGSELADVAALVENQGRTCITFSCDVRDSAAMAAVAKETFDTFGHIDILVPQAAVAVHAPLETMADAEWDLVLGVNLLGVVRSLRPVIPIMKHQHSGRIVVVGSVGARSGAKGVASYVASKWGLIGLAKSAAMELGPFNITVNAVCPTAINTTFFRSDEQYKDMVPELYEQNATAAERERQVQELLKVNHALPIPWIEPEDVAEAIAFLTSDRARYISGEVLDIAAGWNAQHMG
jgi:NAD(P)-dependent dehydrogenase (short-subunit alcohol dehydrogenase family)